MQCIIVDNELNAIKNLSLDLISHENQVNIIAQFTSAEDALMFLKTNSVDLVFLDIEMPVMNGLQLLDHFPNAPFFTVFTTAHRNYAIEAIKKSANDYLLKPIDSEELAICLERLHQRFKEDSAAPAENNAVAEYSAKKIKIFTDRKIIYLDPDEIIYGQAEGSYTTLFCKEKKEIIVSQNLKIVSEWLPASLFLRVHHSYIVNREKIKEFHRQENYLVLEDNSSVPVSRQRKNEILKLL